MNAEELFIKSTGKLKPSGVFKCSKCGSIWGEKNKTRNTPEESAEDCCVFKCSKCGKPSEPFNIHCQDCERNTIKDLQEKRMNAAEMVDSWDGWVYDETNDEYFESLEYALEWYEDNEVHQPKFLYLTKEIPFKIDFEDLVNFTLEEDHHEDAEVTGLEEITAKVDEWAEKQNLKSYEPDYKRIIKVEQ